MYVFLDQYNNLIFKNNIINLGVIYRNYESKNRQTELLKIAKACKKKRYKLFISNDLKLAIRFKAEIYATEKVLNDAGVIFDEVNVDIKVKESSKKVKTLRDMTFKELNDSLNISISEENYEFAARIRDEIKKRN